MGLGGPSTIPQLKESLRLYLPDLMFIYETKQESGFVSIVCKNLRYGKRWERWNQWVKRGECWLLGMKVFR